MHDEDLLLTLSANVKKYFFDRQYYQNEGLPTYSRIVGENPLPIPDELRDQRGYLKEKYMVRNATRSDREDAEECVKRVFAHMLMQDPDNVSNIERHYMLLGATMPIRLEATVGRHMRYVFYVKRPNIARIFGKVLYNFLSGLEEQDFLFSDGIYIERDVDGYHPDKNTRAHLQNHGTFVPSLVRLAALDELLSINDLTEVRGENEQYVNIITTAANKAAAFDFDLLFKPDSHEPKLIEFMRRRQWRIRPSLEREVLAAERAEIRGRILRYENDFYALVQLMDDVPELVDRIRHFGQESFQQYFVDNVMLLTSSLVRPNGIHRK